MGEDFFWRIHSGLDREGPGDDASTRRALALVPGLSPTARILDVGCGPGAQTLTLAATVPDATIVAVDTHEPFLAALRGRALDAGVADQITTQPADMRSLPFAERSFDLIWSEGAIYIMGYEKGLAAWQPLLKPTGALVVSDIVWLHPQPPAEVIEYWRAECPDMVDAATNIGRAQALGYRVVGHFTLPKQTWWDSYYTPIARRVSELRQTYAEDRAAQQELAATEAEIDIFRKYGDFFGYEFYVLTLPGDHA